MIYPNLEAEMARSGLTQKDVAPVVDKTPETVSRWMNGKGTFSVGAAFIVKEELFPDLDVDYLFESKTA